MKLYFIYVRKDKLPEMCRTTVPHQSDANEEDQILYAITEKKDLKNEFIKQRIPVFTVITREYDKKEVNKILDKDKLLQLEVNIFKTKGKSCKILSTGFEYIECHSFWFEKVFDPDNFSFLNQDISKCLTDKYFNPLAKLAATTMMILVDYEFYDGLYLFDELEYNDDTSSLFVSNNHTNRFPEEYSFNLEPNEVNLFIKIYGKTMKV